jgi:hypothetical protein
VGGRRENRCCWKREGLGNAHNEDEESVEWDKEEAEKVNDFLKTNYNLD